MTNTGPDSSVMTICLELYGYQSSTNGEHMRIIYLIAAYVAVSLSAVAVAGVEFAAYEGPDAVQAGNGGAKITKDGVDFWTQGTPPRRYQVLGFLTDRRKDKLFSGKAVGSSGLAKRVQKLGGDALILADQNSQHAGHVGMLNSNGFGGVNMMGRAVNNITSTFVVIRYLPAE